MQNTAKIYQNLSKSLVPHCCTTTSQWATS